jgi:hypothetical protein
MPSQGGGFEQAYNSQAAVDIDSILIVENHITQQSNDKLEVTPTLESLSRLPDKLGTVEKLMADTGYFNADNVKKCETDHIVTYIAGARQQHNEPLMDRFTEPEPLTGPLDPVTEMNHRLKTIAGKAIYSKRKCTIEPAFGIICVFRRNRPPVPKLSVHPFRRKSSTCSEANRPVNRSEATVDFCYYSEVFSLVKFEIDFLMNSPYFSNPQDRTFSTRLGTQYQ